MDEFHPSKLHVVLMRSCDRQGMYSARSKGGGGGGGVGGVPMLYVDAGGVHESSASFEDLIA